MYWNQWRIQIFSFGATRRRRRQDRGAEGYAPPQQILLIFYLKRRVLVGSDVLNVPVTRTRA